VFHDRVFVKGHGARGHMDEVRDFVHPRGVAALALTRGELLRARLHGLAEEDSIDQLLHRKLHNASALFKS
jgi:hypothetical protein